MRSRADDRLRAEIARFALRFSCDDCVHFDDAHARCGNGYPPEPRRGVLTDAHAVDLAFCKEFELG